MELSTRMKRYEAASSAQLPDRLPVIVRVDGKAFHTYTASLNVNDPNLIGVMTHTAQTLCEQIVGARLAYVQSDEISVLLYPWQNHNSQAWFDNTLQKIVSVSAAIASAHVTAGSSTVFGGLKPAYFDSRAFVLPEEEVNNYFIWRQQDAMRNSVQSQMRANFSHKESQNKSKQEMIDALVTKGIVWSALPIHIQRGACIVKALDADRRPWTADYNIPIFTEDKRYVMSRLRETEQEMITVESAVS